MEDQEQEPDSGSRWNTHTFAKVSLGVGVLSAAIAFAKLLTEGWQGVLVAGIVAFGLGLATVLLSPLRRRIIALALVPLVLGAVAIAMATDRMRDSNWVGPAPPVSAAEPSRSPEDGSVCRTTAKFTTIEKDRPVTRDTPVQVRAKICPGDQLWVVKQAWNEFHLHADPPIQLPQDDDVWSSPQNAVTCQGQHCPRNFTFMIVMTETDSAIMERASTKVSLARLPRDAKILQSVPVFVE